MKDSFAHFFCAAGENFEKFEVLKLYFFILSAKGEILKNLEKS